jgi:hypothetical protein
LLCDDVNRVGRVVCNIQVLELVMHHGLNHGDHDDEHGDYSELAGLLLLIRLPWRLVRVAHAIVVTLEKVAKSSEHAEAAASKHQEHKEQGENDAEVLRLKAEVTQLKVQLAVLGVLPGVDSTPLGHYAQVQGYFDTIDANGSAAPCLALRALCDACPPAGCFAGTFAPQFSPSLICRRACRGGRRWHDRRIGAPSAPSYRKRQPHSRRDQRGDIRTPRCMPGRYGGLPAILGVVALGESGGEKIV